jgi:methylmalonyl-CoA mutase
MDALRFVTATSLFDGHDASINIFRRLLQARGVEVIHLGHNRSVDEIVDAAISEDAHAVAVTSYQGGHLEFFRYLRSRLTAVGGDNIAVFGGGGGTILPDEVALLRDEGAAHLYSPDDGRTMGLEGMVDDMIARSSRYERTLTAEKISALDVSDHAGLAAAITAVENHAEKYSDLIDSIVGGAGPMSAPVIGITGTGGAGKSSLTDEVVRRLVLGDDQRTIAILSVDPTRRRSGGALLGDRIRMNTLPHPRVYMRSMATRAANVAVSGALEASIAMCKLAGFDVVIVETSGIGQSGSEIVDLADRSIYVMTPEYGAATQLEKIDMIDLADAVVINKADRQGADDALRDVRKQFRRNHNRFGVDDAELPVFTTVAAQFNDPGTTVLCRFVVREFLGTQDREDLGATVGARDVLPAARRRYLSEIVKELSEERARVDELAETARRWQHHAEVRDGGLVDDETASKVAAVAATLEAALPEDLRTSVSDWEDLVGRYRADVLDFEVRGVTRSLPLVTHTLSGSRIPKVAVPGFSDWGDRVRWLLSENFAGSYPFTAGIYPLKRPEEDPTRMFAGEGTPEQTNRRFHYLSAEMPAKRLSTAFDSVTLYGEDPAERLDIYGKVGNSGVSIASLDDIKRLYSGFDLLDPATSVSMTINGPAPMILAFFMRAAIDQRCERYIVEQGLEHLVDEALARRYPDGRRPVYRDSLPEGHNGLGLMLLGITGQEVLETEVYAELAAEALSTVRGTVQADILKEDQAQNTCIFSTEFALGLMADIQEWFIAHDVRNFYSVSISGYHMAEAGANPITQLAFTLANGFTFVESYLAAGMDVDDFAPNLSFFFSNGLDPEYAVIGRVARRIWARAMKLRYGGNERSQKLKYHIQTSGRSLHAQEISFNDIRTTLQALYAVYDNCNSLHTNAYDEAVTTPTEESVRRAMAIQLIINRELGMTRNENPLQGSFIIDELTDLVEEAVLAEFMRLDDRGGVLGAMERQYQRSKIQEESMLYEQRKQSGELPIIGVNTFLSPEGSPFVVPESLVRSDDRDKNRVIGEIEHFKRLWPDATARALERLQAAAVEGTNVFEALLDAAPVASLGQMSEALYEIGGRYRRNM